MSRPQLLEDEADIEIQSQATSSKRTGRSTSRSIDKDEAEKDNSSHNDNGSFASHDEEADDDDTSSSNVTSSNDSEDGTKEENVTQEQDLLTTATRLETKPLQTSDLHSKLSAFLPQIAQANEKLTTGTSERVDDVADDEEHYIEMNLGLGVLTEKPHRKRSGEIRLEESSSSDDSSMSSEEVSGKSEQDSNVMKILKGQKTKSKRRKIEELG